MKIVSWNVNSVRSRLERITGYLDRASPDVLCMQETKVVDESFPREAFTSRGYTLEVFGQKTYNGVALASRLPLEKVVRGFPGDGEDAACRLIGADVGGLRLLNLYVPNGQAPGTDKYAHKLDWLKRLKRMLEDSYSRDEPVLLVGDFNIAPEEEDVYDPEALRGKIHFSDPEREALQDLMSWGLVDLFREFVQEGGYYTWWDYRALSFPRDKGLRIDLFLATPAARELCTGMSIHRDERKGTKPSDHVPVEGAFKTAL